MPSLNTEPDAQAGTAELGETCAADVTSAEILPLDMYLMLDTSLSMSDSIGANSTKWSAVKSALRTFLHSQSARGIGVGLQYFPLPKPNLPASCVKDADCGDAAPCILSGICWNDLKVFGQLNPCYGEADCLLGSCVVQQTCENDPNLFCSGIVSCGKDSLNNDLGACKTVPGVCAQTSVCEASAYADPAQPIAALPGASAALISSLDAQTPAGNTPTGPALSGALQQASDWASAHPDHRVVVVLATDGSPTNCSPTNTDEISDIAGDAFATAPNVKTVVIGVLAQADIDNGLKIALDKIARGGGTDQAILVDAAKDITAQFQAALESIRTDPLACEFKIPEPAGGKNLDYARVNVSFNPGKHASPLYYVGSLDDCDPDSGGWYYDRDPERGEPSTILVCPVNCTTFQASTSAKVEIALGCETIVK